MCQTRRIGNADVWAGTPRGVNEVGLHMCRRCAGEWRWDTDDERYCTDCGACIQDDVNDADEAAENDDPYENCSGCGAGFDEEHDWDCPFDGDEDEDEIEAAPDTERPRR